MGGYSYKTQVNIGRRFNGRKHIMDVVAEKDGRKFFISLKWQQSGGTAEEKVPFELMCLIKSKQENPDVKIYLVLAGNGWVFKDFFLSQEFKKWIHESHLVEVIEGNDFIALANQGKL